METIAQKSWSLHNLFSDDVLFHHLFPAHIQRRANRHWTPMKVARCVAEFLVPEAGARVLDIGSGVGTFCLAAAFYEPQGLFYGVEQRKELTDYAIGAQQELGTGNVSFIHGNFTQLNLSHYDHFYFFNSFYE